MLTAISGVFAEISDRMADRTVEVARSWQPDVVVHTPIGGAGPLAATLLSVPRSAAWVRVGTWGGLTHLTELVFRAMRPAFERHGLSGEPTALSPSSTHPPEHAGP